MRDLIRLIKDIISSKQIQLNSINDSMIKKIDELLDQLVNNISLVNVDLLKEVLEYINRDNLNYNVSNDIGQFMIVKFFKEHNNDLSSKYKINDEQNNYILYIIRELEGQKEKEKSLFDKRIDISREIDEYAVLLQKISKNDDYIDMDDIELLSRMFEDGQVDYKVRYMLLSDIFQNNVELYKKMELHNDMDINDDNKERMLIELFEKYAFNFMDFDLEYRKQFIDKGDLLNIEDMIKLLIPCRNLLQNKNTLPLLLLYSNPELFNDIKQIGIKDNIPFKDLLARPGIFIDRVDGYNSDEQELDVHKPVPSFKKFISIESKVTELGFKYKEVFESGILDTEREDIVLNNMMLVGLYNIPGMSRRVNQSYSYSSFRYKYTFDLVDQYIELGLYNYARYNISAIRVNRPVKVKYAFNQHLNILGNEQRKDDSFIPTIKSTVLKNEIPYSTKQLEDMYFDPCKVIPNSKIYSRILRNKVFANIDPVIFEINPIIGKLEKYITKDGMAYDIDGVLISRNKVLRLFTALMNNGYNDNDALLYVLTYNSYLTETEFYKLQNIIELLSSSLDKGGR